MRQSRIRIACLAPAIAGAIFVSASAALNITHAAARADGLPLQITFGGMALAASIGVAVCVPAFVRSASRLEFLRAVVALIGLCLFGSYSLTCALGSSAAIRIGAAQAESDAAGRNARAQAALDAAQGELATIGITRVLAEVQAEIRSALAARKDLDTGSGPCVGWLPSAFGRAVCIRVADLQREEARAKRRETLLADSASARSVLDHGSASLPANPDAKTIASLAGALGFAVEADRVTLWLTVLTSVLVELGGGICFTVAGIGAAHSGKHKTSSQQAESPPAPGRMIEFSASGPEQSGVTDSKGGSRDSTPQATRSSGAESRVESLPGKEVVVPLSSAGLTRTQRAILAAAEAHPGSNQRELAGKTGEACSTVCRSVRELARRGLLIIDREASGATSIRLAA